MSFVKATNKQIACIWVVAKKQMYIDSEGLHDLVYNVTGKTSISKLSKAEAEAVIKTMSRVAFKDDTTELDPQRITHKQTKNLYRLMYNLNWRKKQLDGMVKRVTGVEKMEWLTRYQANDVIEALKAMIRRNYGKPQRNTQH